MEMEKILLWLLGIMVFVIIVCCFIFHQYVISLISGVNLCLEQKGQFGDSFGVINSIFTGLAFFAAFLAFIIQNLQLKQLKKQNLDDAFFSRLENLREIRNCIKIRKNGEQVSGLEAVSHYFGKYLMKIKVMEAPGGIMSNLSRKEIVQCFENENYGKIKSYINQFRGNCEWQTKFQDDGRENIDGKWKELKKENEHILDSYFRNVYYIADFIEKSNISKKEKQDYLMLFRAQLSYPELSLIFYDGITKYGKDKFQNLFTRLNFFKNIIQDLLESEFIVHEWHLGLWKVKAYFE